MQTVVVWDFWTISSCWKKLRWNCCLILPCQRVGVPQVELVVDVIQLRPLVGVGRGPQPLVSNPNQKSLAIVAFEISETWELIFIYSKIGSNNNDNDNNNNIIIIIIIIINVELVRYLVLFTRHVLVCLKILGGQISIPHPPRKTYIHHSCMTKIQNMIK